MTCLNFTNQNNWFAWYPVPTENGGWVFWEIVLRIVDDNDEKYLGLLPTIKYYAI